MAMIRILQWKDGRPSEVGCFSEWGTCEASSCSTYWSLVGNKFARYMALHRDCIPSFSTKNQ